MTTLFEITNNRYISEINKPGQDVIDARNQLRLLQDCGFKHGLPPGQLLSMLNYNYKCGEWGCIDIDKIPEMMQWICNNYYREYQLFAPYDHIEMMKTCPEYSEWFNQHDKNKNMESSWT